MVTPLAFNKCLKYKHKVSNFRREYQVVVFLIVAHEIVFHVRHLDGLPRPHSDTVSRPACAVFCSGVCVRAARSSSDVFLPLDGAVGSPQIHENKLEQINPAYCSRVDVVRIRKALLIPRGNHPSTHCT